MPIIFARELDLRAPRKRWTVKTHTAGTAELYAIERALFLPDIFTPVALGGISLFRSRSLGSSSFFPAIARSRCRAALSIGPGRRETVTEESRAPAKLRSSRASSLSLASVRTAEPGDVFLSTRGRSAEESAGDTIVRFPRPRRC